MPQGETCAGEDEIRAFFEIHRFLLTTLFKFIDFDNVDNNREIPLESVAKTEFFEKIDLSQQLLRRVNFIEHRVTL